MSGVLVPWAVEVGLITWRTTKRNRRAPLPSELAATALIFGTFSILGESQPTLGATLGWGIVVATFLNLAPEFVAPHSTTDTNSPITGPREVFTS